MAKAPKMQKKGAEEARTQLPGLLADAARGTTTVITRHGRPIAAVVPWNPALHGGQKSLLPLTGSGKGYWGRDSAGTVRKMRDEWRR